MFDDHPFLVYTLLDPDYYDNIERYLPREEYITVVKQSVPDSWKITPHGFWTHCTPLVFQNIEHGWKIHISSTLNNATETLELIAALVVKRSVAFKFSSDARMLRLSLNKNWPRSQAGKFIAIYPRNIEEFQNLIEDLHQATKHLQGPHVLTDRGYRDSRVVYYRYGEHLGRFRINRYGHRVRGFMLPDGTWYKDVRGPTFRLPPGQTDPFTDAKEIQSPGEDGIILKGHYRIKGALKYSATGGIYYGEDEETGRDVIIREMRSGLGQMDGADNEAAHILHKEARILRRLEPTGYAPAYVDLFQEWEHWFLVQERLDADTLWSRAMQFYFAHENQTAAEAFDLIRATIEKIATGLEEVHKHGVILRDLTRSNVMFTPGEQVKFIDFEFSHEMDDASPWLHGWTAGYAAAEQMSNQRPAPEQDYYAFGVLILDVLTFCASGFELNRDGIFAKLRQNLDDNGLPAQLYDVVAGLTDLDPKRRWTIQQAVSAVKKMPGPSQLGPMSHLGSELTFIGPPKPTLIKELEDTVVGIGDFLDQSMDLSRNDRLWPASAEVFASTPVSLEFGAAGPAFFLMQSRSAVDARILDWIQQQTNVELCPPGLYSGLAGVALLFLSAGRLEKAEELMRISYNPTSVFEDHGLYYGASGWGLANLHFWHATGCRLYLERAQEVGDRLLSTANEATQGLHWSSEGKIRLGLGEGQSGVALFLVYLGMATGDTRFLEAATRAMDFDLAHSVEIAGQLLWKPSVGAGQGEPNSPHTLYGSAGVGTAALRCFAATGEERFKRVAKRCAHATGHRFTNKIWQHHGIAGYGEFMLDMHHFLGDASYRDFAYWLAEGCLAHRIYRSKGVAFPGLEFFRICCDYAMGSSGVGLFMHRLLHGAPRLLMLDSLFEERRKDISAAACVDAYIPNLEASIP